jgi:hypothetical protein
MLGRWLIGASTRVPWRSARSSSCASQYFDEARRGLCIVGRKTDKTLCADLPDPAHEHRQRLDAVLFGALDRHQHPVSTLQVFQRARLVGLRSSIKDHQICGAMVP